MRKIQIRFSNYDSPDNPQYGGGGALSTHTIAKYLVNTGRYKVSVVCSKHLNSKNRKIDGVNYIHVGISSFGWFVSYVSYVLFLILEIRKQEKYDIWFENFTPPYSTNFLQLFTRKPVVGIASLLHAENFTAKYKLPFTILEKLGLKSYNDIILLNSAFEKKIRKVNKTVSLHVIPRGIDPKYVRYSPLKGLDILYLGRIDIYQKGLDMLIGMWASIEKNYPNSKLLIAGTGPTQEILNLKKLINDKGLSERVVLLGRVAGDKKIELLRKCIFGVCPSRFEGFGNSTLEFLAFKKPVILFDIDGMDWVPKNAAFKIKSFDQMSFINAMKVLLDYQEIRHSMSNKGREYAKSQVWPNIIKMYEKLISKLTK